MRGHEENSTFVQRFDVVRKAVIRMQVVRGLCWGICTVGAAIAALAAADYFLEWPWHTRATWLVAGMGFAAFVSAMGILRPVLHWSRRRPPGNWKHSFPTGPACANGRAVLRPRSAEDFWRGREARPGVGPGRRNPQAKRSRST